MIDVHVLSLSQDGVLVATLSVNNRRRGVAICPAKYQKELMYENHRITHLGVRNTTQRIQLDWYWPGMHADIQLQTLSTIYTLEDHGRQ